MGMLLRRARVTPPEPKPEPEKKRTPPIKKVLPVVQQEVLLNDLL